ncbi:MAG: serine/threonine protein kinase [Planctomycetes bacterium]|nr:serine/threonine protein kinase [Planctomycetota bacterium]
MQTADFAERPASQSDVAITSGPPGRRFGKYVLLEELGRGGMGIVFKAWDQKLHRHVALKMLIGEDAPSHSKMERFREEVFAAAKVKHAQIVVVHEVDDHEGVYYFTMQLIEGGTLEQFMKKRRLDASDAAKVLGSLARTMAHAHDAGILHLDLKPSNILINEKGQPFITDFGLAREFGGGAAVLSGGLAGTPKYMAPEQADHETQALTPATDVFSLGVVCYEMLTGITPFAGANLRETIDHLLTHEPARPRRINPNVDSELEAICLKCLRKNPRDRYQSAAELAEDLEHYVRGEPTSVEAGDFSLLVHRLFRATEHAWVLKNWGSLWMLHGAQSLVLCLVTYLLTSYGFGRITIALTWTAIVIPWSVYMKLRRTRMGAVGAVERIVEHIWIAGGLGTLLVFFVEWHMNLPVLSLSYCLAIIGGIVFYLKGGLLSGKLYLASAALFACSAPMMVFPDFAMIYFGVVASLCFLIPGYSYYRASRTDDAVALGNS